MARLSKSGKYILSANEIGSYIVCPEAWRLREVEKVQPGSSSKSILGNALHKKWQRDLDESIIIYRYFKVALALLAVLICTFLIFG